MIPKREVRSQGPEARNQKSDLHPQPSVLSPQSSSLSPLLSLGGVILLIAMVRLAAQWRLPLPPCMLRTLTGIPCPFCGSTRSLLAWSHFEIIKALCFNPLTFLLVLVIAVWFLLWMSEVFLKRPWLVVFRQRFRSMAMKVVVAILVLLNWIYLCLTLPP